MTTINNDCDSRHLRLTAGLPGSVPRRGRRPPPSFSTNSLTARARSQKEECLSGDFWLPFFTELVLSSYRISGRQIRKTKDTKLQFNVEEKGSASAGTEIDPGPCNLFSFNPLNTDGTQSHISVHTNRTIYNIHIALTCTC